MSGSANLARQIQEGLITLGLMPESYPVASYVRYIELLQQWNSAYNLTAIRDPEKMVTHHILDSLSVLPFLNGDRCLDAGTGAGLPGLILALANPGQQWVLLDSNRKKIRFVNQAVIELQLENVKIECIRAEHYRSETLFTTIITRAFGRLKDIYRQTRHLLAPGGSLLAMKGQDPGTELAGLDQSTVKVQTHFFPVPGIKDQRSLVEIKALPSVN